MSVTPSTRDIHSKNIIESAALLSDKERPLKLDKELTVLIFNLKADIDDGEKYYAMTQPPPESNWPDRLEPEGKLIEMMYGEEYWNLPEKKRHTLLRDFMHLGPKITTMASRTKRFFNTRLGVVMANQPVLNLWNTIGHDASIPQIRDAYRQRGAYVGLLAFGNTNGDFIGAYCEVQRLKGVGVQEQYELRGKGYQRNGIFSAETSQMMKHLVGDKPFGLLTK
jgi:hypothetical protein